MNPLSIALNGIAEFQNCCNWDQNLHTRAEECIFEPYETELELLISMNDCKKSKTNSRRIRDPVKRPLYKRSVKEKMISD